MSTPLQSSLVTSEPNPRKLKTAAFDRIRSERNLEKWPLWQPAHSKNKSARAFSRVVTDAEGRVRNQQVKIDFTALNGTITTEDQKTFYALVKIWEEQGRPLNATYFSLRQLAKVLKKRWGTNVIESLTKSLTRLRTIGIIWIDSYFDNSDKKTKSNNSVQVPFTILGNLRIIRRDEDGHVTTAAGYFKFDDDIEKNLRTNFTKPVLLDVVLGFKSEVAQILYTHFDLILADKTRIERRSKELFAELGLAGKAYANLSDRKRLLERAAKELVGVPLSTGRIASATVEETKDEMDCKIVISKSSLTVLPQINHYLQSETPPEEKREEPSVESLPATQAQPDNQLMSQAEQLVKYFYKIFHQDPKARVTQKALDQAIAMITQSGYEVAEHVVTFAHKTAPETNYKPQTFGGIIQYASRAIADFERERRTRYEKEASERVQFASQRLAEEYQVYCRERIDQYLSQLPSDDYRQLVNRKTEECKVSHPMVATWPEHYFQRFINRAIRGEIFKRLQLPTQEQFAQQRAGFKRTGPP